MKRYFIIIFIAIFCCSCSRNFYKNIEFKNGDLFFQDIDCGDYCESIESVTEGYQGAKFSHIGILKIENGKNYIIEAVGVGVRQIPLDTFLHRSKKVIVGRLKSDYQQLIPKAIEYSSKLIGKQYDEIFDIENDKYYCSELIYFAFKSSNANRDVFELKPMTFKAKNSKSIFPIWQQYFDDMKVSVPEGKLGLNPGGISLSDKINIIKIYEKPDGFTLK